MHKVFSLCSVFTDCCLGVALVRCSHTYWTVTHVIGQLVKLLQAFASTFIPDFSLLEICDQDFCSLLDINMFRNGASYSTRKQSVFLCRHYICCTEFQQEYINAIRASRSLWTQCTHCYCTMLSNIFTRYTEMSCQGRLVQQVMP
jgi:hypothetical protein